jgi:site-specific DNA recombinase
VREKISNGSTRAAAYTRVSTGRQAEKGLSLDAQRQRVEEHAHRQGWELVDVYEERGISGRKANRPALDRMLAERDRFDRLIVPKLDRLGRSATNVYATIKQLNDAGIRLVCLDPNIDTTTREGRFLLNALVGVGEMESDLNSERVRETAEARVARGRDYGSRRPLYGYRRGPDGVLVPVPAQAAIVQRVFTEYVAGAAQREIERGLIADGIPSATGGMWRLGTVSRMLRRVEYIGKVRGPSGTVYPGLHDAIIETETYERAQRRLATTRKSGVRRNTATGHLLRGRMLQCGYCRATMIARTDKGLGRYVCATRKERGVDACRMPVVPREMVEQPLLQYFDGALLDLRATRDQVITAMAARRAETNALRHEADRQVALAESRLARVRRDYQDGALAATDWAEQRNELTTERDAARAELERLEERAVGDDIAVDDELVIERLADLREAIFTAVRDANQVGIDAVRAIFLELFDHFVLTGEGRVIVPVPRPEAVQAIAEGVAMPVADIGAFTSQKTSLRPRRTITSSSFPPTRTFAARIR